VAAGGALLAAGVAYATIPDAGGVIHGCYAKTSQGQAQPGQLRVIDTGLGQSCQPNENAVSWNQKGVKGATGPQGPVGQQGTSGPKGATGATGPSDVWSVDGYGQNKSLGLQTWKTLATVSLPAGSFVVQGEASLSNTLLLVTKYGCDLVDSSSNEIALADATNADWTAIPVQTVVTFGSSDTISLRCIGSITGGAAYDWKLEAVKVGTVH
jgi:hypothetical protein